MSGFTTINRQMVAYSLQEGSKIDLPVVTGVTKFSDGSLHVCNSQTIGRTVSASTPLGSEACTYQPLLASRIQCDVVKKNGQDIVTCSAKQ